MSDFAAAPPNALAHALRVAPKVSATVIMLALSAIWLGPIVLIVLTSIKSNQAFLDGPFALPRSPTLAPYVSVWESMNFGGLLANSLLYATVGSALAVALALVPAFAQPHGGAGKKDHLRSVIDGPDAAAANCADPAL